MAPTGPKRAYHGRRERYEVKYLPPPWKRSLTESGMTSRRTRFDEVVVAVFVVLLAAVVFWGVRGAPL